MNKTQRNSVKSRGPSRLRRAALLFIIHTSSLILAPLLLAANDPTGALQKGLFEEEANHNLDAAIAAYQSLVTQFDQDRKLAATAVFRLGECYRKLGRTNEAVVQYQRVLRDFSDQPTLVTLSRQDLGALGTPPAGAGAGATAPGAVSAEANVLATQLAGLEKLKNDPEERARAVLALFPDDDLRNMLVNLPKLQEQEAKFKAVPKDARHEYQSTNVFRFPFRPGSPGPLERFGTGSDDPLASAEAQVRQQLSEIADRVDFILGLQKARLQALQAAGGPTAPGETATSAGAAPAPDAEQREIQRIQTLLAESPDLINAPGKNGETLLQAAAGKGQLEVVQFLLDHGAAVNGIEQPGLTPLHFAAGNGHLAVVDLLLRRGAKPDSATKDGITPLHLAVFKGYAQVAKALIDAGAPVNARMSSQPQGLSRDDLDFGGLKWGTTPLDLAIEHGYREIAELLVAAHADINARDDQGHTPLMTVVAGGPTAMVQLLLDHGADPNAADSNGNTALHRAAQNGSPELVALLLAHKADVNAKDKSGNTPLHLAAASGNVAAIQALVAAKADVNARNNDGETPLLLAAMNQKREAAEALLAAGADPNLVLTAAGRIDHCGPLIYAVAAGDASLTRDLLDHGANPNLTAGGWPSPFPQQTGAYSYSPGTITALDGACFMGNATLVKLLLDHGADPNTRYAQQQTPLLSRVADKPEILRLLLEHQADPKLTDKQGETPLHAAVRLGTTNGVALLLAHGAAVNARDNAGNTPLLLAVVGRNKDLVEFLLAHQADPNLLNQYGQTPLDLTKLQAAQPPPGPGLAMPPLMAPPGQVDAPPPKYASPAELADLLRRAGAQDWVPRPGQITVTRRSTGTAYPVFRQGTNALNRFTLFEAIAALPWAPNDQIFDRDHRAVVPFPDFSKVTITRRDPKTGKLTDIPVDAAALLAAGDCSKDVPLEWGDLVDIPDREHKLNEGWRGLPTDFVKSLAKCLERKVTVELRGQPQAITLWPEFLDSASEQALAKGSPATFIILRFRLKDVLTGSARLLSTSDLTRVTVRRVDSATGQPREWVFNEQTVDPVNDLWVRDGDVIAVPEKP